MRCAPLVICLLALYLATLAEADPEFKVVLHARTPAGSGRCDAADLPDCANIRPTTQVVPNTEFRLYIFAKDFGSDGIHAFQTGFDLPGDWKCDPDDKPPLVWGCHIGNYVHMPMNPGGPLDGTLAYAFFDCFQGIGFAPIARIDFLAGAGGCLTQINPIQGTQRVEILTCQFKSLLLDASDPVEQLHIGSICAGIPGRDACDPMSTVVEPATWGSVKATYR